VNRVNFVQMRLGISFLLLFVVGIVTNAYEFGEQKNPLLNWRNPFFEYLDKTIPNKVFNSTTLKSLATKPPSGYIVTTVMQGDNCDGNAVALTAGVGMDVCYVAENAEGVTVGSVYFYFGYSGEEPTVTANVYEGDMDCKGDLHQEQHVIVPIDECLQLEDEPLSFSFSYTEQSDPWEQQPPGGLLQQVYDTKTHCEEKTPMGIYTLINTNVCVYSVIVNSCGSGYYNINFYADKGCTVFLLENDMALNLCKPYQLHAPHHDADVLGYGSLFCS